MAPSVNKCEWSAHEDHLLLELHSIFGNAWCEIAKGMPGRTDNSVKNRWNTWLRHQLKEEGGPACEQSILSAEAHTQIKLTSLLRTNPHSSLASLVTEQVDAGLDALVGLVRATSRSELQQAANALKRAVAPCA